MGTVKTYIPDEEKNKWMHPPTKEDWAIRMLMYAQACIREDCTGEARSTISTAIRILKGDYRTSEDGFAIEIDEN